MERAQGRQVGIAIRKREASRWSDAEARVLCYLFGPVFSALMLFSRQGHVWPIRFHAVHSMLLTAAWGLAWGALRLVEEITPWFLGTLLRELRFAMNLGCLLVWICLLIAAYRGVRCAAVPYLHGLAVRLARRSEKRSHLHPASATI